VNIKSVEELGQLAKAGWEHWTDLGMIKPTYYKYYGADYVMLSYTYECQLKPPAEWNFVERVSRGLILCRRTGHVITRPFDKFWNHSQVEVPNAPIKRIYEKMDGSLLLSYFVPHRLHPFGCTKGSFSSEQAVVGSDWLRIRYDTTGFRRDLTYLFEIIYKDNRIVVDYGIREELVLLAIRENATGKYFEWDDVKQFALTYGFGLPQIYIFDSPEVLEKSCKTLHGNAEGYIVEFENGKRVKYKGDEYLRIHRLLSGISFKNTLAAYAEGRFAHYMSDVPDMYQELVQSYVDEIEQKIQKIKDDVESLWIIAPKTSRKDYAEWVMREAKDYFPYMFNKWCDQDMTRSILKKEFKKRALDEKVIPLAE
jgi:RNA ligase